MYHPAYPYIINEDEEDFDDDDEDDEDDDSEYDFEEESEDEYEPFIDDAFNFIKGIEKTNLQQFPHVVIERVKALRRKPTRSELLEEMKLALNSIFDTRLSILQDFTPRELKKRGINSQDIVVVRNMINNSKRDIADPSTFIRTLIDMEKKLISDNTLKNILEDNPKIAYKIVRRYSNVEA